MAGFFNCLGAVGMWLGWDFDTRVHLQGANKITLSSGLLIDPIYFRGAVDTPDFVGVYEVARVLLGKDCCELLLTMI